MKSDRLVVLVAPEEKARLVALAEARHSSVGELVREAVANLDAPGKAPTDERAGSPEPPMLQADQAAMLERLADVALHAMQRANAALDQAFEEVEATKAYFAAKRSARDQA
jgi:hypothetical protein